MTRRGNFRQADIERAIRAVKAAAPSARLIIDLDRKRVEIILSPGESAEDVSDIQINPWDEEDGPP